MLTINDKYDLFVKDKLLIKDYYIANETSDYTLKSFNNCVEIYNKLAKTDLLFDYFPKLWAFVFYKDIDVQQKFINDIYIQMGYDYILNSFKNLEKYQVNPDGVIIKYKSGFTDFIKLD